MGASIGWLSHGRDCGAVQPSNRTIWTAAATPRQSWFATGRQSFVAKHCRYDRLTQNFKRIGRVSAMIDARPGEKPGAGEFRGVKCEVADTPGRAAPCGSTLLACLCDSPQAMPRPTGECAMSNSIASASCYDVRYTACAWRSICRLLPLTVFHCGLPDEDGETCSRSCSSIPTQHSHCRCF